MKSKIKAIGWAFSLAWRSNKVLLVGMCFFVSAISILPAVALAYNKKIIGTLNDLVATGNGNFNDILPTIITFGVITALIGLSNRVNSEFIYSVMYNSYYFAMSEVLMDSVQNFSMEEVLQKDAKDEYYACVMREGSLTDVISGFYTLLGKFVALTSLLIVAFTLSKLIFVISLIYIIGVVWLNLVFVEKLRYNRRKIWSKERLAGHYEEMPFSQEYAKELRVFESGNQIIKNWKEAYAAIYNFELKENLAIELRTFISGFGFYLFLIIMIVYSLFSVANGAMTASALLVIFTLCLNIYTSVTSVTNVIILTDHGLFALERQYYIFASRKEAKNSSVQNNMPITDNGIVFEAKHISYSYRSDKLALDDVSLTIRKGETIALVGANGSGKSTLVKLLLQLYKPVSGNLYFHNEDYDNLGHGFLKNRIGPFFQDYYLFHRPIGENIGYGDIENVANVEKINNALEKGGAAGFVSRLSQGKDTFIHKWIEKSGADFSGGERQKLAVSRAHMSDKEILIFDEPASMLDPISELEQFMNIKEKIRGRTAILISHRVGFARLADRIILLDDGKVAETGTHNELMAKNGLYARFFNEQAQWYLDETGMSSNA